jgi:uncharacterized protein (DUF2141 family)
MKTAFAALLTLLLVSCNDFSSGPPAPSGLIVASVHWGNQGVPGVTVVLVQTGDTVVTGTNGLAVFSVPAGQYTVRAFGINRGGPTFLSVDFDVTAKPDSVAIVDIIDCLPCV